jgi:transcriptional regulator with XRE-family HTH domain
VGESGRRRLARLVRARRESLGLYREQIPARGGPTTSIVTKIERGDAHEYTLRTYERLEAALEWPPGTITQIRRGGLTSIDEHHLVTGLVSAEDMGLEDHPAREVLTSISDGALLAELERRLGSRRA